MGPCLRSIAPALHVTPVHANPKGGNHGSVHRDGEGERWDPETGGGVTEEETAEDVLLAHLYLDEPVALCLACTGLRPTDSRAFTAPDLWLRLPEGTS